MGALPGTGRRVIGRGVIGRGRIGRRAVLALIAGVAMLATGCAAGDHAATSEETPALDSASGTIGTMQLHAVALAAPTGGPSYATGASVSLEFIVVNTGEQTDSISAITSASATGAEFVDATTATGSSSAVSSSPAASSSAAAPALAPIDVPAGTRKSFGIASNDPEIALTGLTAPLYGSNEISVTFDFAKAGELTLTVPVQLTDSTSGLTVGAPSSAD